MKDIAQLIYDIHTLKIQGATNIALATLKGIKIASDAIKKETDPYRHLLAIGKKLAYARPNEPLAQNAIRYIFIEKRKGIFYYLEKAKKFRQLILSAKEKMVTYGADLVKNGSVYLTHCHSSSVVGALIKAKKNGKRFKVYVSETRPLYQGRITAEELLANGIDVTFMVDGAVGSILEDKKRGINGVFLGGDLLTKTGFINKVGSLAIMRFCEREKIPLYTLSLLLKYDFRFFGGKLIEQRESSEIWPDAPKKLEFFKPAFDFVPFSDTVKIVTEEGVIKGIDVEKTVNTLYTFLKEEEY